jgi:hypothetical protein
VSHASLPHNGTYKRLRYMGFIYPSGGSRFPEGSPNAALKRGSTLYTKGETALQVGYGTLLVKRGIFQYDT